MGLFTELRRRNVFRVAIAYAITAWVLAQIADLAFDNFGAPEWVSKSFLLVLLLGFPIAVLLAWAFELTPEGIKRESEVDRSESITHQTGRKLDYAIIAVLVVAVAFLLHDRFDDGERERELSIAVLPFENRSAQADDQYFTDGIHDDLLTTIANIGSMRVISRTSVMEYKDTTKKIPEIAAELGVATVLEGGVQRAGNQVRINVQLIDAQTDEHLWAEIYDRELTAENLFAIQSEVSKAVADALHMTLSPEEEARVSAVPTQSLEALEAYLRGRELWRQRSKESTDAALELFLDAVQLDPDYALAWVGLSDAYRHQAGYSGKHLSEVIPLAQAAVEKALSLDDSLGEAHTSLGAAKIYYPDLKGAEASFQRALELNPSYEMTYNWYGIVMNFQGEYAKANELFEKGLTVDPTSAVLRSNIAINLGRLGEPEKMREQYERLIDVEPDSQFGYVGLAEYHHDSRRRPVDAIPWFEKASDIHPDQQNIRMRVVFAYLDLRDFERAREVLDIMQTSEGGRSWYYVGEIFYALAMRDVDTATEFAAKLEQLAGSLRYVPPALRLLTDRDLAAGETERAIDRYRITHPELFSDTGPGVNAFNDNVVPGLAGLYQQIGDSATAEALLIQLIAVIEAIPPRSSEAGRVGHAVPYALLGREAEAMARIRAAVESGLPPFWWMDFDVIPELESLRSDPKFQRLREQAAAMAETQRAELPSKVTEGFVW